MKKSLVSLVVLLLASNAYAFGGKATSNSSSNATAGAAAGAIAGSSSNAKGGNAKAYGGSSKQKQGQAQGQIQSSLSGSSSDNSVNITDYDIDLANTAYAPDIIPTSDCLGAVSLGGQGRFLGFSLGGTTQSKPCNVREFAKMNAKSRRLYHAIMCQDSIMRKAYKTIGKYDSYCKPNRVTVTYAVDSYESNCDYPNSTGCRGR